MRGGSLLLSIALAPGLVLTSPAVAETSLEQAASISTNDPVSPYGDQHEDAFYVRFESETEVTAISPRVRVVPLPVVSETYFSALRL